MKQGAAACAADGVDVVSLAAAAECPAYLTQQAGSKLEAACWQPGSMPLASGAARWVGSPGSRSSARLVTLLLANAWSLIARLRDALGSRLGQRSSLHTPLATAAGTGVRHQPPGVSTADGAAEGAGEWLCQGMCVIAGDLQSCNPSIRLGHAVLRVSKCCCCSTAQSRLLQQDCTDAARSKRYVLKCMEGESETLKAEHMFPECPQQIHYLATFGQAMACLCVSNAPCC